MIKFIRISVIAIFVLSLTGYLSAGDVKDSASNLAGREVARTDEQTGSIKLYLDALHAGDFEAAARQLMYPANLPVIEKKEKLAGLVKKIKSAHEKFGDVVRTDSTTMPPAGKYLFYPVSMIPLKKHPPMSAFAGVNVTFSKVKKGALKFMMGEVDGQQGIYEVQYMCFTCVKKSKVYVKKNSKGHYRLILSRKGKEYPILRSGRSISMPALSDDGRHVAYISNERGEADLFIIHLSSGRRMTVIKSIVNPLSVSFSKNKKEVVLRSDGGKVDKYDFSNDDHIKD